MYTNEKGCQTRFSSNCERPNSPNSFPQPLTTSVQKIKHFKYDNKICLKKIDLLCYRLYLMSP